MPNIIQQVMNCCFHFQSFSTDTRSEFGDYISLERWDNYRILWKKCAGNRGRGWTFNSIWLRWNSQPGLLGTWAWSSESFIDSRVLFTPASCVWHAFNDQCLRPIDLPYSASHRIHIPKHQVCHTLYSVTLMLKNNTQMDWIFWKGNNNLKNSWKTFSRKTKLASQKAIKRILSF